MAALGEATETPERLWTAAMRANTAEEVAHLALQAHAAQVSPHTRKKKKRLRLSVSISREAQYHTGLPSRHASLCSSFLNVS